MDPIIDPFRSVLVSIASDCTNDNLKNMKFLCVGRLPEGRLEAISNPLDFFNELIHECYLESDKKQYLASLLFHIGRHDLKNRLQGHEGNLVYFVFRDVL